jgi:DNA topoisomerase-3
MKKMVDQLVYEVRTEKNSKRIVETTISKPTKKTIKKGIGTQTCPKCNTGIILKGKSAFGCSNYKNRCNFTLPFTFLDKKISENQYIRLLIKGETVNLKGFKTENGKQDGHIKLNTDFNLSFVPKELKNEEPKCPKCKKGTIIKGKSAYGCSTYKNGCDFTFPFDLIRKKANGKKITKELVLKIIQNNG